MRRMLSRLLFVLAVTALTALAADNSLGTWKANIAKCKYNPGPLPRTRAGRSAPGSVK